MSTENRRSPGYYGARVEEWVLRTYGLVRSYEPVNGVRMDAVNPENGQPVEIKAVASNRRGGRANEVRFKIWRDQHDALVRSLSSGTARPYLGGENRLSYPRGNCSAERTQHKAATSYRVSE